LVAVGPLTVRVVAHLAVDAAGSERALSAAARVAAA
jgi:hypothetical protein